MSFNATILRLEMDFIWFSKVVGFISELPIILKEILIESDQVFSSMGFAENQWSGPGSELSNVKCFSNTLAPKETAKEDARFDWVWSEYPNGNSGKSLDNEDYFCKFTFSGGVGYSEVVKSKTVG